MRRRSLLVGAGAALLTGSSLGRAGVQLAGSALAERSRFNRSLPIPEVLTGAEIDIPIVVARIPILPGRRTRMWTYAGSFPGPTIRRPAGQRTRVRFHHRLPAETGELTVHLHGGHNRFTDDGQPGGLTDLQPRAQYCDLSGRRSARESGNELLIRPGESRTYTYDLIEDGAPERACFQWYHDHRLERTARNVWRGLAGMWIVDDEFDASLPLPRGRRDLALMLTDRSFNRHNQLTNPFGDAGSGLNPPLDGISGRRALVNGALHPYHRVRACRYRLRLLNTASFQPFNVSLAGLERPMVQIATESGLMPAPLRRRRILLGPGERAEVIVDFSGLSGRRVRLRSDRRRGSHRRPGSDPYAGALMEFRVGAPTADGSTIPERLRPLPAWVADAPSRPSHTWRIAVGAGLRPRWTINGSAFDPGRSEVTVELGSTVTWELVNASSVAHLMHLHHTDWYMLSRNGRRPPPWERCLKETFFLEPRDRVLVSGHISDHPGRFVVHCHMLDHEDHGLMSQFEVVPATASSG